MSKEKGGDQKPQENPSDVVDLEVSAKSGAKPPKAKAYRFRVDKIVVESPDSEISGAGILTLAGKLPPANYILHQIVKGQPQKVDLDAVVDLRTPGLEKFRTLPRDQTEGFEPRREFQLSQDDTRYLDSLGLRWEALRQGSLWVVIYGWHVAPGYNVTAVDVAIEIAGGYPLAQLDMAYFSPHLARKDGCGIPAANAVISLDGKVWQRWSRHRTAQNPWRPGEDSLETHMALVDDWLTREFERRP